jgi:DNA-binding response OmpR family regulator
MSAKSQTPPRVVLVVEDDVDLRRMFRAALSLEGFIVEEAGDGLQALHLIEQSRPDIVVLDLGLPTVGGLAVQQEIAASALTKDIPVVIVTGSTADLSQVPVFCVLRKPVTPEELVATVRRCIQSGAPS